MINVIETSQNSAGGKAVNMNGDSVKLNDFRAQKKGRLTPPRIQKFSNFKSEISYIQNINKLLHRGGAFV